VFASSAFVPTAHMPGIVRTFADINRVTLVVNAARALTIAHGHVLAPALGTLAWLTALLLIFVPPRGTSIPAGMNGRNGHRSGGKRRR
jgi:hypothetical protein